MGAQQRRRWPQRRIIVALTFVCTAVCYIERTGFSIAYTAVANSAGLTQASKGNLLSAFYYGYSLSQVPGGWVAQRVGGRRVLLWSFVAWAIACAATPSDPTAIASAAVARAVVGVAQGLIFPSLHTVLAQWVPPHERSRSVSLTTSGMYLGAALAMLFLPELLHWRGPRAVYAAESAMGVTWALLWALYATDAPPSELPKASAAGFGNPVAAAGAGADVEVAAPPGRAVPWSRLLRSPAVWAIVVNNFSFHYVLYVLMSWLPTFFEQGLRVGLQSMGSSKMAPYLVMFLLSNAGGVAADYLITRKLLTVARTRKWLNAVGFAVAALGLLLMPRAASVRGAVLCSSLILGATALARAGFAVNHMDIAPRYAGIVMGISNTAGTFAGIIGVNLTGFLLQSAPGGAASLASWALVFSLPALLCLVSAAVFCIYARGERIF